ncbi:sulfurtransferase [Bacillus carboniphilus]|uniref:Sulfurtransferase n=1 Tax=Bacillus carboniphilus TaxID=86663 RepID=A0ABN0WVY3_9BACI
MIQKSSNLFVEARDLFKMIENQESITVLDCRFDLKDPEAGKAWFRESHILHAQYMDLEQDLSGKVEKHGGRHPLPSVSELEELFQIKGVSKDKPVVVYDQGKAPFAARCYWTLKFLGHPNVYILQGGYTDWIQEQYPITGQPTAVSRGDFTAHIQKEMVANYEDVKSLIETNSGVLVDSRELVRYQGKEEPIDKKAGRIPSSHHYFWLDVFTGNRYKSSDDLIQQYQAIQQDQPIVVYCGSGVTAAPNVVALYHAGYKHVKLYIGSFSDWISYEDSIIATGDKNLK